MSSESQPDLFDLLSANGIVEDIASNSGRQHQKEENSMPQNQCNVNLQCQKSV